MDQHEKPTHSQSMPNGRRDTTLNIENMLLEEFKYASTTAYQALEDRVRMINLYYVLLGLLAAGVSAIYQLGGSSRPYSQLLVILLFLVVGGLSLTFFINIIRLRQSFLESIMVMNVIKEFYIQEFQDQMPHIDKVFRWRLKTIPAGERIGSVTFVMSYLIALMGSLCLAVVAALTVKQLSRDPNSIGISSLIIAIVVFALTLLVYTLYYRHSLSHRSSGALELKRIRELLESVFQK